MIFYSNYLKFRIKIHSFFEIETEDKDMKRIIKERKNGIYYFKISKTGGIFN